jgi:hypothetical protein
MAEFEDYTAHHFTVVLTDVLGKDPEINGRGDRI